MLVIEDLCINGADGTPLFKNFNMRLRAGELAWVSGASGKGKTTLFKALLGFNKIECGSMKFIKPEGEHLAQDDFTREMCWLPQQTSVPDIEVRDYLETIFYFRVNRGLFNEQLMQSLREVMGFSESIYTKKCRNLSGGEFQRVRLWQLLMLPRKIYLLDEPLTGVDPANAENITEYIRDLNERRNSVTIVISHQKFWANYAGKKVIV